jgi:hypothetical protein
VEKYVKKERHGPKEPLIHTLVLMQIWAASKYCKDPNYAKGSKKKMKNGGLVSIKGQGIVMKERLR